MNWFWHTSDLLKSPKAQQLFSNYNHLGLSVYCLLLEFVTENNVSPEGLQHTATLSEWREALMIDTPEFLGITTLMSGIELIQFAYTGDDITIEIVNPPQVGDSL